MNDSDDDSDDEMKKNRRVQLLESGSAVQEGIQLLSHSNLHPVLHARYRVLGVFLAGSERRACSGVTRYKLLSKHKALRLCVRHIYV